MKRFLLAGLAWLLCLGSVTLYMNMREDARDSIAAQPALALQSAHARYDLEVTLTFRAEADPFALNTNAASDAGSISLNGVGILELAEVADPGVPWRAQLEGVVAGPNELFVQATPPGGYGMSHAVRVRLIKNGVPMREKTFWSEGGGGILGTLHFDLKQDGEDGHDH